MQEENKEVLKEIEVVTTVEITYVYGKDEIGAVSEDLPRSPEELEQLKKNFAETITRDLTDLTMADHVLVTGVQYFEKYGDAADESAQNGSEDPDQIPMDFEEGDGANA